MRSTAETHLNYLCVAILCTAIFMSCDDGSNVVPNPHTNMLSAEVVAIQDEVNDKKIVVVGNQRYNFIVSYSRELEDGTVMDFQALQGSLPMILRDQEGNQWDIFGYAREGARIGQSLPLVNAHTGYWFGFASRYPGIEIYSAGSLDVEIERDTTGSWSIPTNTVHMGAGFDAIEVLDFPPFIDYRERDFLDKGFYIEPDNLVVGYVDGEQPYAFPHPILDWHEIINIEIGDMPLAVIYGPFTGTTAIWERKTSLGETLFGVSGKVYNNNIIPFDRTTNSYWAQLDARCVKGLLNGEKARRVRSIETSWKTWNMMYFKSKVLSEETGSSRDYSSSPFSDYKTDHTLIKYPVSNIDARVPNKERVHCVVVGEKAKVYRFSHFQ